MHHFNDKSLKKLAELKAKKMAFLLAIIISVCIISIFITFKFLNYETIINIQLQTNIQNFEYWFKTGDSFQTQRTISNIVNSLDNINNIEVIDVSNNFKIADATSPKKFGTILLTKKMYIANGKGLIKIVFCFDYLFGFILIAFTFICYFLLNIIFRNSFIKLSNTILIPIQKFSDELNHKDRIDEIANMELNSSSIYELRVFQEQLKNLGIRLQENEFKLLKLQKQKIILSIAKQVAHDIRSPLTSLKIATKQAKGMSASEASLINKSIQRIQDIAEDLLSKDRLQHTENDLQLIQIETENKSALMAPSKKYKLADLVSETLDEKMIEYQDNKKIEFKSFLEFNIQNAKTFIDPATFKRVLSNLINNAVEAIKPDTQGIITIDLNKEDDCFILELRDNGCGISESDLVKILDHGKSINKAKGNGLGLKYAKKIIENLNGSIKIFSTVGIGTTVKITLPIST
ncbi:MAG: HAMP domain-containing histidine kinase [Bdellovibrionaceae bacterium]|nr:HAMP domain-containing histidine kinase [Pseudobdellovibrionaceae bacterium]